MRMHSGVSPEVMTPKAGILIIFNKQERLPAAATTHISLFPITYFIDLFSSVQAASGNMSDARA
jgi:hypothetical protein